MRISGSDGYVLLLLLRCTSELSLQQLMVGDGLHFNKSYCCILKQVLQQITVDRVIPLAC